MAKTFAEIVASVRKNYPDLFRAPVPPPKVDNHMADAMAYGVAQARYALPGLFPKKEKPMNDTPLFSVFRASNGFYATYGGKVAVGETMSEVCTAISALIADEIVREEQMAQMGYQQAKPIGDPWQKVT